MRYISVIIVIALASIIIQLTIRVPWWSYLCGCFAIGVFCPFDKWNISAFGSGFVSGFIVWAGATFYFHQSYSGELIDKIARLLKMSSDLLVVLVGTIGGTLTALALYVGYLFRRGKVTDELEKL